jgi:hypothetical protein
LALGDSLDHSVHHRGRLLEIWTKEMNCATKEGTQLGAK